MSEICKDDIIERCIGTYKKDKGQKVFPREVYVLLNFIEYQPDSVRSIRGRRLLNCLDRAVSRS